MPYIGRSTEAFGVRSRFTFLASADDTSVSGNDVNGLPLSFTDGAYVDVFLNGVRLKHNTDYVTTTANTIGSLSALAANDEVEVIVYDVFSLADMVSSANGGNFFNQVNFKTDSAVIAFGADNDVTLTHSADTGLILKNTSTTGNSGIGAVLTLQTGDTDIAQTNVLGRIDFQAPDEGTGTDAILVAASIVARAGANFSSSVNSTSLEFMTGASEAATKKMSVTANGNVDIFTDGASIEFGADSEIRLTHVADTGLILKHTATADDKPVVLTLQTGETDIAQDDVLGTINFQAPDEGTGTDAILVAAGISAVSEGDFSSSSNATKLVFKTGSSEAASEKMSLSSAGLLTIADDLMIKDGGTIGVASTNDAITISSAGIVTFKDDIIIKDAGTIGSASDVDAISIGSDGDVTLTQDLELQHDGAILSFGADDEIQFIHVADTGLVLKHANTADDKFPTFTLQTGDTDIAQGDKLGRIEFQAPDEGAGTDAVLVAAAIEARSEGDFSSSNNATSLLFQTGASETATEKMKITSAGLVGIDTGTVAENSASKLTINVDNAGGLCINNIGQTNGEHGTIFFASHATSSANVKQGIGVKRNGDFGVGDMVFAVDSNADNAAVSMGADKKMSIRQQGDLSIQANTTGFANFTGFGTVTIADESSITLTSGSHAGGANHLFVYETGTGSNCRFYFGYNKSAIETNVEIGGIAFHNADQDGVTCLINDGTHTNTLKNREGSSTTYKLLKVGVGATFNDTAS